MSAEKVNRMARLKQHVETCATCRARVNEEVGTAKGAMTLILEGGHVCDQWQPTTFGMAALEVAAELAVDTGCDLESWATWCADAYRRALTDEGEGVEDDGGCTDVDVN